MIEIKVYKPIDKEDLIIKMFGIEDEIFNTEKIQSAIESNPEEKDFKLLLNTPGGSVAEGLRSYDVIRNSGKTWHSDIENECHSMGVVLLLSAPFENRTANPNCRALIHQVRAGSQDGLTADQMRQVADQIEQEQNAILDIYVERTGKSREDLVSLIKSEKILTAQDLLNWGFISKINSYNTNLKTETMSNLKKTVEDLLNKADAALLKFKNLLEEKPEPTNYDHMDADGNVLFTTEKEDDSLAVGDEASPDGTFVIADGRTVIIADGVITEIQDAPAEDVENLQAENEALVAENTALKEGLTEAQNLIVDLKNQITSNHKPANRVNQPVKNGVKAEKSAADYKAEMLERSNKKRGGNA